MAKWGEGDPRWIVEERADATNVNNWHWTEKNATPWSKDKLKELLEGLKLEDETYKCTIKELTKIEGEASASNRKAKLIFFYEWDIKAEWSGHMEGSTNIHKGKIEIPNLSEEYSAEEVDITVTADSDKDDEAYKLKEFLRLKGSKTIQEKLAYYIKNLKTEFSQGMILSANSEQPTGSTEKPKSTENAVKRALAKPVVSKPDGKIGVKIKCKTHSDKQFFKCRASDLYRALTEKDMVSAFTRNDATIQPDKGSRFVLFGGSITGEFVKLDPYNIIEMKWRSKSWPDEHYSMVTLILEEAEDGTNLTLSQTGVPESDFDRTRQGWSNYYWESIRQTFGFGSRLF